MDRNLAWADCTASCRCSGLKGSSEKYILWKERSKLENAYLLVNFRFDTAEKEPAKNLQTFANFATKKYLLPPKSTLSSNGE